MTNKDKVRFTFRLPEDLYSRLGRVAEEKGVSVNALILQILWDHFEKKGDAE